MTRSLLLYLKKNPGLLLSVIVLLTVTTLLLTLLPSEQFTSDIWDRDLIGHFLLFGSWTLLLGLYRLVKKDHRIRLWPIFAAGIGFGLLIELLQYILPVNRSADPLDVIFDGLGSASALLLLAYLRRQIHRDES